MDMEKLKAELKRDEGVRFYAYQDPVGVWTCGVGHNLESHGFSMDEIMALTETPATEQQVDEWLDADIFDAIETAKTLFPALETFTDARQRALVNMAFNMGFGTLRKFFRTIHAVNSGLWTEASNAASQSKWYRQVGNRAKRIVHMLRTGEDAE
jgi:lysozyme